MKTFEELFAELDSKKAAMLVLIDSDADGDSIISIIEEIEAIESSIIEVVYKRRIMPYNARLIEFMKSIGYDIIAE